MKRARMTVGAAALATIVLLTTFAAASPASAASAAPGAAAWTNGVCTDATGVTVVIDFQELGGGVHVRCAPQPVGSGFDALRAAGIDYTTTVRFPGFICKIAGKPENDPCQTASPASAYWSYWIAPRGGSWCYSNWGAGNRTPPPGSVEAWSFSLNRTASTSPAPRFAVPGPLPGATAALPGNDCDPSATAPKPTPTPQPPATAPPATLTPPSQGGGTNSPVGSGGGPAAPAPAAPNGPAGAPPAVAPYELRRDDAGAVSAPPAAEAPVIGEVPPGDAPAPIEDAAPVEEAGETDDDTAEEVADGVAFADSETASVDLSGDSRDKGSALGLIVAVVLVAALAGGAFVVNRRRADTGEQ